MAEKTALVVGSTGIVGLNLSALLVAEGWRVFGLARRPGVIEGLTGVAADLQDMGSLERGLDGLSRRMCF